MVAAAGSGVGDAAVTAGLPSLPAGEETAAPAAKAAAAAAASFWAICAYEKRVPLLSCSQKKQITLLCFYLTLKTTSSPYNVLVRAPRLSFKKNI